MRDEHLFTPDRWSPVMARHTVGAISFGVVLSFLPQLLYLSRGVGWIERGLFVLATAVVVVPAMLLWVRFGLRGRQLVVTPDAIELRRRGRTRRRVSRLEPGFTAFRSALGVLEHGVGPVQLVITDGTTAIRLSDARWSSQHDAILAAAGVQGPTITEAEAREKHPEAFPLHERRPAVVGCLLILVVFAAVVGGGVVVSQLTS